MGGAFLANFNLFFKKKPSDKGPLSNLFGGLSHKSQNNLLDHLQSIYPRRLALSESRHHFFAEQLYRPFRVFERHVVEIGL